MAEHRKCCGVSPVTTISGYKNAFYIWCLKCGDSVNVRLSPKIKDRQRLLLRAFEQWDKKQAT